MKNRYLHISTLILALTFYSQSVNAQQGFGTNQPHKSAAIDIKSNSRGLLIPRVTLSSLTSESPIATPVAEGLLVYNIGDSSDPEYNVEKGFYYWFNNKWNSFLTSLNSESTDDQVIEDFRITTDHKLIIKIEGDSTIREVNLAPYVNKSYALSSQVNDMILSVDGVNLTPAASIISDNTLSIENGTNNTKILQSSVNGEESSIDITNLIREEQIKYSVVNGNNSTAELVTNTANEKSYKVNVATATTSNLGVVKIGSGFETTTDGTLNVEFPVTEDLNSITKVEKVLNQEYVTVSSTPNPLVNTGERTYTIGVNKATKPTTGDATYGVVKIGSGFLPTTDGTLNIDFPVTEDLDTKTQVTGNGAITVSPNTLIEDTTNSYTVSVATANLSNLGVVKGGGNVNIATDGTLSVNTTNSGIGKTLTGNGITVTAGSTVGTSTFLANTVLADVTLGIENNAVTTDKIANNAVTAAKINPDVAGAGLIQNTNGALDVNANNGLKVESDIVKLGGALTEATTITTTASHNLTVATTAEGVNGKMKITGLQTVAQTVTPTASMDKVLLVASDGTLKQAKAVMPKFFYAPAVYIPTHNTTTGVLLTGAQTIDLYNEYTKQFNWQGGASSVSHATSGTNAYGQARSSTTVNLPVLSNTDLEYFVTYYDATVFNNVQISATGIMTYTVNANVSITPRTFINVVFKVKD